MPKATKTQSHQTVFMSPPTYFDIEYSINPWMNLKNTVDKAQAKIQWQNLKDIYKNLGLKVKIIDPVPGVPDLVFTTDHGVWIDDTFYVSNFRFQERQKEQEITIPYYKSLGIKLRPLPSDCFMEGGDVLYHHKHIYVGHGFRTSDTTCAVLEHMTGRPVIALELVDEAFYHLDTCFLPISRDVAFYFKDAFDSSSIKKLKANFDILIPLSRHEAEGFAANSVRVGNHVLCQPNPTFEQKMLDLDLIPIALDMSQFNKSGGGIHCLSQIILFPTRHILIKSST